ncbi:MAG: N-acetyltransferase [Paraglaciecola sp.]|uniref:GNAT family N-acetyltransferase n=1 Tax=Paraglaciecola sp. TaxID=1920173 RepID=UPI0032635F16
MITKLENSNEEVANQIRRVFQRSYKIEAELIGVCDFPPLARSIKQIVNAPTDFYGFIDNHFLAAILEIDIKEKQLDIHSLTVDPTFFRKGIADKLISFVLKSFDINTATVETAEVNQPAINLYKKHGFIEFKRWTPSHGIPKVAMSINPLSYNV